MRGFDLKCTEKITNSEESTLFLQNPTYEDHHPSN